MNKKMMVLGGLLLAVVVTGYSVSGAYAKYVDTAKVSAEARVAKFKVTGNNDTFKLFTTGVGADGADKIIAPGYYGETTVKFDVTSDIPTTAATFEVVGGEGAEKSKSLSYIPEGETDAYDPMKYVIVDVSEGDKTPADSEYQEWSAFIGTVSTTIKAGGTYKIAWKWFSDHTSDAINKKDTALGNAMADATDANVDPSDADVKEALTARLIIKATVEQDTNKLNKVAGE